MKGGKLVVFISKEVVFTLCGPTISDIQNAFEEIRGITNSCIDIRTDNWWLSDVKQIDKETLGIHYDYLLKTPYVKLIAEIG